MDIFKKGVIHNSSNLWGKGMIIIAMSLALGTGLLSGCHNREGETRGEEEGFDLYEFSIESSENIILSVVDEKMIVELERLEPILYLVRTMVGDLFGQTYWQANLFDLTRGEIIVTYELNEYGFLLKVVDLGDGYYAGIIEDWTPGEEKTELIILDESLKVLERLSLEDHRVPWLFDSLLKFENGELFVYVPAENENWETDPMTGFLRINFHRGEIKELFDVPDSLRVIDFVTDTQAFFRDQVTDWYAETVHISYGILDLEIGEIELFETNNFESGWSADINGSYILLNESPSFDDIMGQVLVLNTQEMSTQFVQLHDDESITARLSFDGQHIVVINERESFFRKYDFNGVVVNEVEINLPSLVPEELFGLFGDGGFHEIIPISENIYSIHSHGFPVLRNIQFIRLP